MACSMTIVRSVPWSSSRTFSKAQLEVKKPSAVIEDGTRNISIFVIDGDGSNHCHQLSANTIALMLWLDEDAAHNVAIKAGGGDYTLIDGCDKDLALSE